LTRALRSVRKVVSEPEAEEHIMDSTQSQFGPIPPAMDPFGAPHLVADQDGPTGGPPSWTGDPATVPLPAAAPGEADVEHSEEELDRAIFAALLAP
jgi:hypothetical protein